MRVDEHTIEIDASPVFFRSAPGPDHAAGPPALYLHGIPTSSDDWVGLLERTGGLAPDLLGFGRTGKGGQLDFSLTGEATFLDSLLTRLEVPRVSLVAHDWGAAFALRFALDHPERVERVALLNPLCPVPSLTWSGPARTFRLPLLGELAMGVLNRRLLARALRRSGTQPQVFDDAYIDAIWQQFDQGTQRAILRLHRAIDNELLTSAEAAEITAPVSILWGERDTWLHRAPAEALAAELPDAELVRFPGAGHWPWLDDSAVTERLLSFITP